MGASLFFLLYICNVFFCVIEMFYKQLYIFMDFF